MNDRTGKSDSRPRKRIHVAVGALIQQDGPGRTLLVARRRDGGTLAGYWELPGGKIEPGETAAQCVEREFREELGVQVRAGETLATVEHTYDYGTVMLEPFLCSLISGQPSNLQVAEHRFVTAGKLSGLCFPPLNQSLMLHLAQRLDEPVIG